MDTPIAVSSRGAFAIMVTVHCWNASNDTATKSAVRSLMLSKSAESMRKSLDLLNKIIFEESGRLQQLAGAINLIADDRTTASDDRSTSDLIRYLIAMFEADRLETLPAPEFSYSAPEMSERRMYERIRKMARHLFL
ncbi:MAG: hypothetical protein KGI69_01415 [Patescibacteria group bacterium]|nr:hypothetical protein [Patescibacteria group bacterium]